LRRSHALLAATLLAAGVAPATPIRADWLLMKDGSRVETKGAWEVRGAQVVFTLPHGTLAAVRAADVDFDGSARITAEALAPPKLAATPVPATKPVMRITDADVAHVEATATATPTVAAAGTAAKPAAPATAAASGLSVIGWNSRYDVGSQTTVLSGTVRNTGSTLAYNVRVVVTTLDAHGGLLAKSDAKLSTPGLGPGDTGSFEITYPGAMSIADAKFEVTGQRATGQVPAPDQAAARPAGATTPAAAPGQPMQRLTVGFWHPDKEAPGGSVVLVGELSNTSSEVAYDATLDVTVRGTDGKVLASTRALLGSRTLQPGAKTTFRATFIGVEGFGSADFAAHHSVRRSG
jgi:hypothetical protein